jgi:hypothetical protein
VTKRSGWFAAGALAAFSVLVQLVGPESVHGESLWHHIPGFYGLLGSIALVAIAKGLGKLFLQRPEDYYSDEGGDR